MLQGHECVPHRKLKRTLLRDLEVSVEERLHPLTYVKASQYKQISGFFTKAAKEAINSHDPRQPRLVWDEKALSAKEDTTTDTDESVKKRPRLTQVDGHGHANVSAASSSDELDPSLYMVGTNFIPDLIRNLKAINGSYDTLPASPSLAEFIKGYSNLCSTKCFRLKSRSSMFPYSRYKRHYQIRHAITNVARVDDGRQVLRCTTCHWVHDMRSKSKRWHKPNAMKHFLSKEHWDRLSCNAKKSSSVLEATLQHENQIRATELLVPAIVDDAVYTCCSKSLPHTAMEASLQCTARALLAVKGDHEIESGKIFEIRKQISKPLAEMLTRLKAVTVRKKPNKYEERSVIRKSRMTLARRLHQLAKLKLVKKVEFLLKCNFLSLTCDESDTFSGTAPMAVSLQGCASDFGWLNSFLGQEDVANDKSGEGCYKTLKDIINNANPGLWGRIIFLVTDGASPMRSTSQYAGLDSNPDGTSLHAWMRRDPVLPDKLPNLHCLTHQLNLALKVAIKKSQWCETWLHHVRCLFNWFSRSPGRQAKLKKVHTQMKILREVVTWTLTYPKYYAPTRWLGIRRALLSILQGRDLLVEYTRQLQVDGFRPDRRSYNDANVQDEVDDIDGRDVGEVDDGEIDGAARVEVDDDPQDLRANAHMFYKWGTSSWDLLISSESDSDDDEGESETMSYADLQSHDSGVSANFEALRSGVRGKRTKLMCEMRGVTRLNFGLDAFIADVLGPYQRLVTRLQTQDQPVAHLVKEWVLQFYDECNNLFFDKSANFGIHYQQWKDAAEHDETKLRRGIEVKGKQFCRVFLENVRYRFQPYWSLIMACELANPCSPKRVSPKAWEAAKDLMLRSGKFSEDEADATIQNLKDQRKHFGRASEATERRMSGNLLKFYHDRFRASQDAGVDHPFTLCDKYFQLIASLHISSSVVESYFSRTKYIKSKHRSMLSDKTVSATMHLREMAVPHVETLSNRDPDPYYAHRYSQNTKDDYQRKYVGKSIGKPFVNPDGDGKSKKIYNGTVSHVTRGMVRGVHKWLMHVTYDSDSDEEDLEEYEVKRYMI